MQKLSNKFRYIVIIAFLGSAALSGLTLFSFEKFSKVFNTYRDYDIIISAVNQFQSLVIKQNELVSHYIDAPKNKMIQALERNTQKLKTKLTHISELIHDEDLRVALKSVAATFQETSAGLEEIFISEAEKAGQHQDIQALYHRLIQYLHYVEQLEPSQKILYTLGNVMTSLERSYLCNTKAYQSIDLDLTFLLSAGDLYPKNRTPTQDKILTQLQPLIIEFVQQIKDLRDLQQKARQVSQKFDQVYAVRILSTVQTFVGKIETKQLTIYETWLSKNALTRHSLQFVALFTIVSLCWLMVGLSQLFSLRR